MSTWDGMSRENLASAKKLLVEGYYRKCTSCGYCSVYSAITSELMNNKSSFALGWNNPSHEQVPKLILMSASFDLGDRCKIRKHVMLLRQWREDADYRPHKTFDKHRALEAIIYAQRVISILEGKSHGNK